MRFAISGIVLIAAPGSLPTSQLAAQQSSLRTWTDSGGQYSVEAKLLRIEDGKAVLKKRNGDIVEVPLDKLSKNDREFVRSLTPKDDKSGGKESDDPVVPSERVEIEVRDLRDISIDESIGWQMKALPREWPDASSNPEFSIGAVPKSKNPKMEKFALVRNDTHPTWLLYSYPYQTGETSAVGRADGLEFLPCRVMDMDRGKFEKRQKVPFSWYDNEISSDSNRLLFVTRESGDTSWAAHVYAMTNRKTQLTHRLEIESDMIPQLQFAGNDHFSVTGSDDRGMWTACCDLDAGSLIWKIAHPEARWPCVTRDGQQMVVHADNGLVAIDIASGQQTGWSETKNSFSVGSLSLSPDGNRLVEVTPHVIVVYDWKTGEQQEHFGVLAWNGRSAYEVQPRVDWISDGRLLLSSGNQFDGLSHYMTVVDIDLRSAICSYAAFDNILGGIDRVGRLRYLRGNLRDREWQSIWLPHDEVEDLVEDRAKDLLSIDSSIPIDIRGRWLVKYEEFYKQGSGKERSMKQTVDVAPDALPIVRDRFRNHGYRFEEQVPLKFMPAGSNESRNRLGRSAARGGDRGARKITARELPDGARSTGFQLSSPGQMARLLDGKATIWIPPNPRYQYNQRLDTNPVDIVLTTIDDLDIPALFVRPREYTAFRIRENEIEERDHQGYR